MCSWGTLKGLCVVCIQLWWWYSKEFAAVLTEKRATVESEVSLAHWLLKCLIISGVPVRATWLVI